MCKSRFAIIKIKHINCICSPSSWGNIWKEDLFENFTENVSVCVLYKICAWVNFFNEFQRNNLIYWTIYIHHNCLYLAYYFQLPPMCHTFTKQNIIDLSNRFFSWIKIINLKLSGFNFGIFPFKIKNFINWGQAGVG